MPDVQVVPIPVCELGFVYDEVSADQQRNEKNIYSEFFIQSNLFTLKECA